MHRFCSLVVYGLTALYLVALALFLVGTFGLFGQTSDPLAGVFLIPLGLPWNMLSDHIGEPFKPVFAALAPVINILILRVLCRVTQEHEIGLVRVDCMGPRVGRYDNVSGQVGAAKRKAFVLLQMEVSQPVIDEIDAPLFVPQMTVAMRKFGR